MKRYLVRFIEQFVDGQILLNDINAANLVSDLMVKSVHAPSIMRGLEALQYELGMIPTLHSKGGRVVLGISEMVTTFNLEDEVKVEFLRLTAQCKHVQSEIDRVQQQGAAHHVAHGVSNASTVTAKTFYSEGDGHGVAAEHDSVSEVEDGSPTPPLPEADLSPHWRRYVEQLRARSERLQNECAAAERKVRRLEGMEESVSTLQKEAAEKLKVIETLNKRILRRDDAIQRLKKQVPCSRVTVH